MTKENPVLAGGGSLTAPGFYRTGLGPGRTQDDSRPGAMKSKERSVAVTTDTQLIHGYRCLQDEVIERSREDPSQKERNADENAHPVAGIERRMRPRKGK